MKTLLAVVVAVVVAVAAEASDTVIVRATAYNHAVSEDLVVFHEQAELWLLDQNTTYPRYKLGYQVWSGKNAHVTLLGQWAPKPDAFSVTPEFVFKAPMAKGTLAGCVGVNFPVNSHSKLGSYSPGVTQMWGSKAQLGVAGTFSWNSGKKACWNAGPAAAVNLGGGKTLSARATFLGSGPQEFQFKLSTSR